MIKPVTNTLALPHQVCKAHVLRNTDALVDDLLPQVQQDADGSLTACGVPLEPAVADLRELRTLVRQRRPEDGDRLKQLPGRYRSAWPPQAGETRRLFLDRWNLWPRLTRYRTWHGTHGETLDGTNNACERPIGWNIKERYRSMRGYKRRQSVVNVSRLLCWGRNFRCSMGADLGLLVA